MTAMRASATAWMALAVAVVCWGLSFVGSKIALSGGIVSDASGVHGQGLPPLTLLAIRFCIGALVFGPLLLRRPRQRWTLRMLARILAMAACLPGAYFVLEIYAVSMTTAAKAALIAACIPVTVLCIGSLLRGERPGWRLGCGAAAALAGVAMLVAGQGGLGGLGDLGTGINPGDGLMLLAVLAAAGYMLQADTLGRELGVQAVTAWQMLWGAAFFLPLGLWQGAGLELAAVTSQAWLATLGLALFPTLAAFWAYNHALAHLGAGRASLGINLVPLVAALGAWAMLGEAMTLRQGLGGAGILLGVLLATATPRTAPATQPAAACPEG
ncbi:MAG: DMT family transporter [Desulfovibrio sp.]|nr:DMT family transporter [Desulfovibrio sp.]